LFSIAEIAEVVDGTIEGDSELMIKGVCDLQNSRSDCISYIIPGKHENYLKTTKVSALLTNNNFKLDQKNTTLIRVKNPKLSLIDVIHMFYPEKPNSETIHPSAVISSNVQLGKNVEIGPHVVIENGVTIGNSVRIGSGSFIGSNTEIGNGSSINANVSIYHDITIGNTCIIDSGTVIGADGYGLISEKNKHYKIPHIGSVSLGDNVWIGANCSIDRGTLSDTVIGSGSKLDNLIHIAHNVTIGKNCLMAAQVGIAGSTIIEDNVTLAGQVGIIGQITIGRDSIVAAKSAVYQSMEASSFASGIPARPHKNRLRQDTIINQLPDILNRFRKLEKKISTIKDN